MVKDNGIYIKTSSFRWILFLGVLPIEKAALTLYVNSEVGKYFALLLNIITLVLAIILFLTNSKKRQQLSTKYVLFFCILVFIYLVGSVMADEFSITRILSLVCLLGYYLFLIHEYISVEDFISDINKTLLLVVVVSLVLYFTGNSNVIYIESASQLTFKGIVPNRNSYSEVSLFLITTNFILFHKKQMKLLPFMISTTLATYTTILTRSATSIVCLVLLLILILFSKSKYMRKIFLSNIFWRGYAVIFFCLILLQNVNSGILTYVANLFGKSATLTGRTDIWTTSLQLFSKKFMFGYGYDTEILLYNGIRENDPHNGILYIFLTGGLLGLFLFISMLKPIFINKCQYIDVNNTYVYLRIFLCVWAIRGLVESVFSYTHFVFWSAIIMLDMIIYFKRKEIRDDC